MSTELNNKMSYKVVFVGDGGVGKTCFLHRLLTGHFDYRYIATTGYVFSNFVLNSNYGEIELRCCDCAGQNKFGGSRFSYYEGADAAVVMFDLTSRQTYKNAGKWYDDVRKICPEIPIVLCGNKCELDRKVASKEITIHRKYGINYYDISAKTLYNQDKPFLQLARQLTGREDLVFC